jgi:hypothetical protein
VSRFIAEAIAGAVLCMGIGAFLATVVLLRRFSDREPAEPSNWRDAMEVETV